MGSLQHGWTVLTRIQAKAYFRKQKYLGLPEKKIVVIDFLEQLARVDDDVMGARINEIRTRLFQHYRAIYEFSILLCRENVKVWKTA